MVLLRPLLTLFSRLPMSVLYRLSDGLNFLLYHVFTYRRFTVQRNLSMSFPELPSERIRRIEKSFYRHFTDLLAEGVKSFSMKDAELRDRVQVENMDQLVAFLENGKSVCGVMGHLGNWEWVIQRLALESPHKIHALYQPPSSRIAERLLLRGRQRQGAELISTRNLRPLIRKIEAGPVAFGTLADQGPVRVDRCHWMTFLKQHTPVYTGTEKLARRYNLAVFYVSVRKTGRGKYAVRLELITDDASAMEPNALTETHTRLLEADIREQPEIWLWTHRRWKRSHLRPPELK